MAAHYQLRQSGDKYIWSKVDEDKREEAKSIQELQREKKRLNDAIQDKKKAKKLPKRIKRNPVDVEGRITIVMQNGKNAGETMELTVRGSDNTLQYKLDEFMFLKNVSNGMDSIMEAFRFKNGQTYRAREI